MLYLFDYPKIQKWEWLVLPATFIFYPFLVFVLAFFYIEKKWARICILLFTVIYGYNVTAGDNQSLDLYRYLLALKEVNQLPFSDIWGVMTGKISIPGTDGADLYRTLMMFIVSRFTNNGHILMAAFSLVYGLLYIYCIKIFLSIGLKKDIVSYLILLCFSVAWGLSGIAFVRFPTACLLFFISAYKVFENPACKKYWILMLSVLAVHFGLMAAVVMAVLFFLLKENKYAVYALLIISIIIPEVFSSQIPLLGSYLGGTLQERIEIYTHGSYVERTLQERSSLNWYITLISKMVQFYAYIVIGYVTFFSKRITLDKQANRLFLFSIILLSVSNITMDIPSFGNRYLNLFILFLMAFVCKLYKLNWNNKWVYYLSISCVIFFAFKISYDFRCILNYSTIELYTSNLFDIVLSPSDNTVWSLIN